MYHTGKVVMSSQRRDGGGWEEECPKKRGKQYNGRNFRIS